MEYTPECPATGQYCNARAEIIERRKLWAELVRQNRKNLESPMHTLPARLMGYMHSLQKEAQVTERQLARVERALDIACNSTDVNQCLAGQLFVLEAQREAPLSQQFQER